MHTQLSKNCISCGLQKPLAAFLQITGSKGTTYGNICSACRGSQNKAPSTINLNEENGGGSGSSGVRIGTTARNKAELLDEKFKKDKKEFAEEDLKKRDELHLEKQVKTDSKTASERAHKALLESKKHGFMRFQQPSDAKTYLERHQEAIQSQQISEAVKQEIIATTTDLSVPFLDPQFTLVKFHSPIFLEFKRWLGSSAPIMRTFEQLFKIGEKQITDMKYESKHEKKHAYEGKSLFRAEKDPLIEYPEKAWGHGPARRR